MKTRCLLMASRSMPRFATVAGVIWNQITRMPVVPNVVPIKFTTTRTIEVTTMDTMAQNRLLSFVKALSQSPDRTLLLEHGQEFEYQTRPRHIPSMKNGKCFQNSVATVKKFPDLLYTEGFACFWGFGELVQHAWLTDNKGKVLDVTWSSTAENRFRGIARRMFTGLPTDSLIPTYFGIAFNTEYVLSSFELAGPSILFNPKNPQVSTEDIVRIKT